MEEEVGPVLITRAGTMRRGAGCQIPSSTGYTEVHLAANKTERQEPATWARGTASKPQSAPGKGVGGGGCCRHKAPNPNLQAFHMDLELGGGGGCLFQVRLNSVVWQGLEEFETIPGCYRTNTPTVPPAPCTALPASCIAPRYGEVCRAESLSAPCQGDSPKLQPPVSAESPDGCFYSSSSLQGREPVSSQQAEGERGLSRCCPTSAALGGGVGLAHMAVQCIRRARPQDTLRQAEEQRLLGRWIQLQPRSLIHKNTYAQAWVPLSVRQDIQVHRGSAEQGYKLQWAPYRLQGPKPLLKTAWGRLGGCQSLRVDAAPSAAQCRLGKPL